MKLLRQQVVTFVVAIQFLTTVPLATKRAATAQEVGQSLRYFPLVGLMIGGVLAGLHALLGLIAARPVVDVIMVVSLLMLTGMLHFDGFLDSCDGLLVYRLPEQRLEIMRDSRVGSFAVAGGWALLALKFVALDNIQTSLITPTLLVGPMLGRWAIVAAVALFPYGRESGLGTAYKKYTSPRLLLLSAPLVGGVAVLLLGWWGLGLVGLTFGLVLLLSRYMLSKIPNGLTGDSYGLLCEVCEMMGWLAISLIR